MGTKTLWIDEGKKFKPRNKQAALIMMPAKGFHMPPATPRMAMTKLQRIHEENAEREKRVAIIAKEREERQKANAELLAKREAKRIRKKMKRGHEKQARYMARLTAKIARKLNK